LHASIRILHIRRRVAVLSEHLLVAEFVIALPILREIDVFQPANADHFRNIAALYIREFRAAWLAVVVIGDDLRRLRDRFRHESFQADRLPAPRFDRLAVFAEDRAETDVPEVEVAR
jgi:hypothetical protein